MKNILVRSFANKDAKAAARVFFESIHLGTTEYYNKPQRIAWAAKTPDTGNWRDRLNSQKTFVAEINNELVGFMTIAADGYIDLAFVAPHVIGKGVAKALYNEVEIEASRIRITRLYSEASYPARTFFMRQGWSVIKEQSVSKGDVNLTNFIMEKQLK